MLVQLDRQDVIANNLANVSTSGFKRTGAGVRCFDSALLHAQSAKSSSPAGSCVVALASARTDARSGAVVSTGDRMDFALDGPGYFVLQSDSGERLTRSGDFRLDASGQLTASDGSKVLGQRGPIQVSGDFSIDQDGSVHSNGAVVDRLRIDGVTDPLQSPRVLQGSLEGSNVNAVEEMVAMISAMRAYEACQRTIQSLDQVLDKAINQMGKVS